MIDLFMRALCEYYTRSGEQPVLSITFNKKQNLFKTKVYIDVDEGDDSLIAEAEGKTSDEAINSLAKVWAKMRFENAIETFLHKLRSN